MIAEYKRKSLVLMISGFALHSVSLFVAIALPNFITAYTQVHNGAQPEWLTSQMGTIGPLLECVGLAGGVLFMFGLGFFAKGKGYSGLFGLLGLLTCIGLLIVLLLPDKTPPDIPKVSA
ncbi:MAG TPA: hypothetical protein VMF08_13165 [Candidatus Sulfotelmatobacter sp.]|nr:hypothetical protein [Candidatus Sulfotelmatobacter sp.]